MATSNSVLLLQPPPRQPFFQLREIPRGLLLKLNDLNRALAPPPGAQSDPKVHQFLSGLHAISSQISEKVYRELFHCNEFTDIYLRLLVSLLEDPEQRDASQEAEYLSLCAGSPAKTLEDAHRVMLQLLDDIAAAGREILDQRAGQHAVLFTSEHARMISDLASVTSQCLPLLTQISEYYRSMEKDLRDAGPAKLHLPRKEDIRPIRQQWTAFSTELRDIMNTIGGLRSQLVGGY